MSIKAILLIVAGFLMLALGAIGLLIPVWPTTPFVLCAAGCFAGNPRLRGMLLKISFFREYIENYQTRRGLRAGIVITSLVFLWGMLILSCVLIHKLHIIILLTCIGTAVTIHILMMARGRRMEDIPNDTSEEVAVPMACFGSDGFDTAPRSDSGRNPNRT